MLAVLVNNFDDVVAAAFICLLLTRLAIKVIAYFNKHHLCWKIHLQRISRHFILANTAIKKPRQPENNQRRCWLKHVKIRTFPLLVGMQYDTAAVEVWHFLKKAIHRIIMWLSNSLPTYVPQRTPIRIQMDTFSPIFLALFTTAKRRQQSKFPFIEEWINKMWHMYKVEYYSATERNRVLGHAITRRNLENILPNKISQWHKTNSYLIYLSVTFRIGEPTQE